MTLQTNKHVDRMRRYLPFGVDSAELIYERQSDRAQSLYPVVTLAYLLEAIERETTKTIVLTGDAGHGKTSLCASLLGELSKGPTGESTSSAKEIFETLSAAGDASKPVGQTRSGRPVYILRDLSEMSLEAGAKKLVELLDPPGAGVAIICANEGQLRKCVAEDEDGSSGGSGRAKILVNTLVAGTRNGQPSSPNGTTIVINLNYQSVAAENGQGGFIPWILNQWTTLRWNRWQSCESCDAKNVCPILANRNEIGNPEDGTSRRSAIRDIFAAAEQTGTVITTRQALSVVSYMITGGLSCSDVHSRYTSSAKGANWQSPYMYHQAIFGDELTRVQRQQVPAFIGLRRLDPGKVSRRQVDDRLDPDTAGPFSPEDPSNSETAARTNRDAFRQAEQLRRMYVYLRRADFFNSKDARNRFARMGLLSGDQFTNTLTGKLEVADTSVRDRFLKGLEAVQGIHRAGSNPDFLVLDPAFFSHRARAAVLSQRLSSKEVRVVDQVTHWKAESAVRGGTPEMHDAVEWLNRSIYIRIPSTGEGEDIVAVEADLLRFELLTRWASGLRSEVQHEGEIRGLSGTLAELAGLSTGYGDIQVLVGNELRRLMIDVGEKIRSVRA